MTIKKMCIAGLLLGLLSLQINAESAAQNTELKPNQLLFEHAHALNELSSRRRVNTFFLNEQSVFGGLQQGYVNVGRGNITFERRDLVIVGRMPIVVSRVYDSSLRDSADFSVGWHLSLAQTIKQTVGGTLLYLDETATMSEFVPSTLGYKINPAQNSDIKSVDFDNLGQLQISYLDGRVKHFQQLGDKFRLVRVTDNNKNNITLSYHQNRLNTIFGANNHQVSFKRNEQGKIVAAIDNNGRLVSYHYNKKSQLSSTNDLGDNYHYHGNNLLHKVTDPTGQVAAKFRFGKNNKVTKAKVRSIKHRFKYIGNVTEVKDSNGNTATFVQNNTGITTQVTNAEGFTSRIVLNDRNQITQLWHDNEQQASIAYDENGRPSTYDINAKPTQMERAFQQYNYRYDDTGRIVIIEDSKETLINFAYDGSGNLTQHKTKQFDRRYQYAPNGDVLVESQSFVNIAAEITHYSYNLDGLLATLSNNDKTARFEYSTIGKLTKLTFADGASHRYQYNALGFRTNTSRSDTSAINYDYDAVGNLTKLHTKKSGINAAKSHQLKLDANNQVTTVTNNAQPTTVEYSDKGNPKYIIKNGNKTQFNYDKLGRLTHVIDDKRGNANYTYQKGEQDIRLQLDNRTQGNKSQHTQITSHNQSQAQLLYARQQGSPWQAVIWNEALGQFLVPTPEQMSAPDAGFQASKQRRRLYDAKSTIKKQQLSYDKASNGQFRPPEYAVSNCGNEDTDICQLHGVLIDNIAPIVGVPVNLTALAIGGFDCIPYYNFVIDGNSTGFKFGGVQNYTFTTSGSHSVQVIAQCDCSSFTKWAFMNINVQCPTTNNNATALSGCEPKPIDIILTFDDGPTSASSNNNTLDVLNSLLFNSVQNNIKATFFVQTHAPNRGSKPGGVANMQLALSQGHRIEIHTGSTDDHVSHITREIAIPYDVTGDGIPDGVNGLESDLIRAKIKIASLVGGRLATLVRPPRGRFN
jgi:YD repeat-containing protein